MLLLKQGIKGVFKFKIQFIIILLLSFLATFILSTSLTLSSRLDSSYNNVVNSISRFDYESSNYVISNQGHGKHTSNKEDQSVTPLLDLVSDSSYINQIDANNNSKSYLNFILNDHYLSDTTAYKYQNSLLTEIFKDEIFTNIFTKISTNGQNRDKDSNFKL